MDIQIAQSQIKTALDAVQSGSELSMQAVEKFQSLMNRPHLVPTISPDNETGRVVSQLVESQDAELQKSVSDVMAFSQEIPNMSLEEVIGRSVDISLEMATMQLDMSAKMGVVDSSKSAVETLMKSQ
jgi:type III secretion inner rod protein HrpB2